MTTALAVLDGPPGVLLIVGSLVLATTSTRLPGVERAVPENRTAQVAG